MEADQREELRAWAEALVEGRAEATEDRLWAAGRAILMLLGELERASEEAERRQRESAERLDEVVREQARLLELERQRGREQGRRGGVGAEQGRRRWWQWRRG